MGQLIFFLIFIIALIFGKWVGQPFSYILGICVENPYGAIIVTFLLILAFIRLFNVFVGETTIRNVNISRPKSTKSKSENKK